MRRKLLISAVLVGWLSACGQEQSGAGAQATGESAGPPLKLSPVTFTDIERENMFGAGCSFAPVGGGIGALAIAQSEAGYLKISDRVERFEADMDSAELPLGARQRYSGSAYSFELQMEQGAGEKSGYETVNYPGRLTVRNEAGEVAFDSMGVVQCGS